MLIDKPRLLQQQFDEESAEFKVRLLAERVAVLTKEKEAIETVCRDLEKRLRDLEGAYQRGAGVLLVIPFIGAAIGLVLAYGKSTMKNWIGN